MCYELGDTLMCEGGKKIIVFMTFYVSKSISLIPEKSELGGFWGASESFDEITPYYLEGKKENVINTLSCEVSNVTGRCKCLLIEKDLNSKVQNSTAKKFASILLRHL
tara:strand:+ start:1150 stop:1473 length:324 start_codon:yes stop_codon:yes gene_type:complete